MEKRTQDRIEAEFTRLGAEYRKARKYANPRDGFTAAWNELRVWIPEMGESELKDRVFLLSCSFVAGWMSGEKSDTATMSQRIINVTASPVQFPQMTNILAKDQPEYLPLPIHLTQDGQATSCWKLTDQELEEVKRTGRVYVTVHTFHRGFPPMSVSSYFRPWDKMGRDS